MSICSLGIMGTKYVRDGSPLPSSIELMQGEVSTLQVAHIYSEHTIGNTLAINLRQSANSPLQFVTLSRQQTLVEVKINSANADAGTYELILESYDTNSSKKSTLKTDVIQIVVEPKYIAPSMNEDDLTIVQLYVGE